MINNASYFKSELPKKEFRWNQGRLEQLIEVIQHRLDAIRDVGIYQEWHPVIVDGEMVERK